MARPRKIQTPTVAATHTTAAASADGLVEVRITFNGDVFLDNNRRAGWQEAARVTTDLADLLVEKGLAERV